MSSTGPAGGHGSSIAGGQQKAAGKGSQLHGHYQYVKGSVEETLGRVTGATGLQSTGKAHQTSAVNEMRAAKKHIEPTAIPQKPVTSTSNSDTTVVAGGDTGDVVDAGTRQASNHPITGGPGILSMEGKVERTMGNLFGCKGMQEQGAERVASADALRRNETRGGGSGGIERGGSGLGEDA